MSIDDFNTFQESQYPDQESIIVSYSELIKFQTCQRQYYYRYTLNRKPKKESDAVSTGITGHKLLQTFYELLKSGSSKEIVHQAVRNQATVLMSKEHYFDAPLLTAWTLVDNYIKDNDFTAEAFLVENRFLIPATKLFTINSTYNFDGVTPDFDWSNILIGFTPDIVFQRKGPFYDVEDSKFIQRAWSDSKIDRFQQAKLYQVFLEKMGYNVSRSSLRFFNVKTGKISVQHYTMNAAEKEILIRDFLNGVKALVEFKLQNSLTQRLAPRTMNYTACQFCSHVFPCKLEAEGKDASKTLENEYTESDYDYRS